MPDPLTERSPVTLPQDRPLSVSTGDPARWADALLALPGAADPAHAAAFDALARAAAEHQRAHGAVYRAFVAESGAAESGAALSPGDAAWTWRDAPLLPIEAFRLADVAAFDVRGAEAVFVSSGTTAQTGLAGAARHAVRSLDLYRRLSAAAFASLVGRGPFVFACHLPGYAERGAASSLVTMAEHLVGSFGAGGSGFFLDDLGVLDRAIDASRASGHPLLLLGAAFGLLDLAESGRIRLPEAARVIETGGMKTRRREMPRADLHAALAAGFGVGVDRVGSEFGMAEATSQGWAATGGRYAAPPWLRVRALDPDALARGVTRDVPPAADGSGADGRLALVDLASVYACPFLLTDDRARVHADDTFEVLGRMPATGLRGCNFLLDPP